MPDVLSQLYKNNETAQRENIDILGDISRGKLLPEDYKSIPLAVPDISKASQPTEPLSAYSEYMNEPAMVTAYSDIDALRAQGQGIGEQIKNAGIRAVADIPMGTIANLAAIADVGDIYNVDDEVGNSLSRLMMDKQEEWKARFPIYRETPGKTFDVGDSGWWIDNISNLLDSAGAFALTGYITGGILSGIAKSLGAGSISPASQLRMLNKVKNELAAEEAATGVIANEAKVAQMYQSAINNHISILDRATVPLNAMALNQAESIQEGMGVYKDVYNNKIAAGDDDATAKQKAADAASLNVNLNRANILLNLTSAGIFTNAGRAITKGAGGIGKQMLFESAQEALEEGVNYIAQKEAMKQSEDGNNYQWDTNRALGHLSDAEGMEAMFLGALGGGMQTGLTHAIMSGKNTAREAMTNLRETREANAASPVVDKPEHVYSKSADVNNFLIAKKNAKTPEEHAKIDDEYLTKQGSKVYLEGETQFNTLLNYYGEAAKKDANKEAKDTGQDINDITNSIQAAKTAYDKLLEIKKIGDDANILSGGLNKTLNPSEIINKSIELNNVSKSLKQAENALSEKIQVIRQTTPETDENKILKEIKDGTVDEQKAFNNLSAQETSVKRELSDLVSKEHQDKLKAVNEAKKAKKVEAKKNTTSSTVVANTPQTPGKPIAKPVQTAAGPVIVNVPTEINNLKDVVLSGKIVDSPAVIAAHKIPNYSDKSEISNNDLVDLTGDIDIAKIVSGTDGDSYIVVPQAVNPNGAMLPPSIQNNGNQSVIAASRSLVSLAKSNKSMRVSIGDAVFKYDELDSWMKNPDNVDGDTTKTADNYTKEDLLKFIKERLPSAKKKPIAAHVKEDVKEPDNIDDEDTEDIESGAYSESKKREDPAAINYLTEEYVSNAEGIKTGTNVINEDALVNSDWTQVYAGRDIIIAPHTEKVNTINYDKSGNSIVENGKKQTSVHDADSALIAGREIPIGIYLNENGKKGKLIGFLPETAWLNEGGASSRVNLANTSVITTNEIVDQVSTLRGYITNLYATDKSIQVNSKVRSVGNGHPLINKDGYKLVSDVMKDIVADVKKVSGKPIPFAHISSTNEGAAAYIGNDVVSGTIVNIDMFAKSGLNGSPVILLPVGDNKFYAVPAKSKTIAETQGKDDNHILNGLLAFLGLNNKAATEYNAHASKSGTRLITEYEGLRDYLKSFVHIESTDVFGSKDVSERNAFTIFETESGIILKFGSTTDSKRVMSVNLSDIASTNKNKSNAALNNLTIISGLISTLKHNFTSSSLNSKVKVIGIVENGIKVLAKNQVERYTNTLTTNAMPANTRRVNGKNIYTIQPVVSIDVVGSINEVSQLKTAQDEKASNKKAVSSSTTKEKREVLTTGKPGATQATIADIEKRRQDELRVPAEKDWKDEAISILAQYEDPSYSAWGKTTAYPDSSTIMDILYQSKNIPDEIKTKLSQNGLAIRAGGRYEWDIKNINSKYDAELASITPAIVNTNLDINGLDLDNFIYVTHQTDQEGYRRISASGFDIRGGLIGTTLFGNKESITSQIESINSGHGHRGADRMIVFSFPKSKFGDVRNLDEISDRLIDEGTLTIPPEYIYGVHEKPSTSVTEAPITVRPVRQRSGNADTASIQRSNITPESIAMEPSQEDVTLYDVDIDSDRIAAGERLVKKCK